MKRLALLLMIGLSGLTGASAAADEPPLTLEAKIPLGRISGRIDHLAIDPVHHRLFVAELGNNSVGVVDLDGRKLLRTITGLAAPQGVGYAASTDTLYVANAGDGSVRLFTGTELAPAGRIDLGEDADNVRVDDKAKRVFIGYGGGALAVIDPAQRAKVAAIPLAAHPESFQLGPAGDRIFVNLPDAHAIAVVDRAAGRVVQTWPQRAASANFPMALDEEGGRVISVFRRPARLIAFAAADGGAVASIDTCGDADDVFVDGRRQRVYVSCGEGVVEVLARDGAGYRRLARVPTASGARTSFFDAAADRLYVALRATAHEPAAIWVLRPAS
jgi:hypothetical protein